MHDTALACRLSCIPGYVLSKKVQSRVSLLQTDLEGGAGVCTLRPRLSGEHFRSSKTAAILLEQLLHQLFFPAGCAEGPCQDQGQADRGNDCRAVLGDGLLEGHVHAVYWAFWYGGCKGAGCFLQRQQAISVALTDCFSEAKFALCM